MCYEGGRVKSTSLEKNDSYPSVKIVRVTTKKNTVHDVQISKGEIIVKSKWEKQQSNANQKETGIVILMSYKIELKSVNLKSLDGMKVSAQ